MTIFWTLIAAIVIGLIIGVPLAWWMNRPAPECYEEALRRHEAFGRELEAIQANLTERMRSQATLADLKAKIRELEERP